MPRLSEDLPVVVEIVDAHDNFEVFLPEPDAVIQEGLATLVQVRAVAYRHETES